MHKALDDMTEKPKVIVDMHGPLWVALDTPCILPLVMVSVYLLLFLLMSETKAILTGGRQKAN